MSIFLCGDETWLQMTQDPFDQDDWAAYAEFNKKCGKDAAVEVSRNEIVEHLQEIDAKPIVVCQN